MGVKTMMLENVRNYKMLDDMYTTWRLESEDDA
jgi:hypothetical protein